MKDNKAIITQIKKDRLNTRVKQLDINTTSLHCYYNRGTFMPIYVNTHLNKVGVNTKFYDGETLQQQLLAIIGFKYYFPDDSKQYQVLEIHLYDIGEHRGIFLLKEINKKTSL